MSDHYVAIQKRKWILWTGPLFKKAKMKTFGYKNHMNLVDRFIVCTNLNRFEKRYRSGGPGHCVLEGYIHLVSNKMNVPKSWWTRSLYFEYVLSFSEQLKWTFFGAMIFRYHVEFHISCIAKSKHMNLVDRSIVKKIDFEDCKDRKKNISIWWTGPLFSLIQYYFFQQKKEWIWWTRSLHFGWVLHYVVNCMLHN